MSNDWIYACSIFKIYLSIYLLIMNLIICVCVCVGMHIYTQVHMHVCLWRPEVDMGYLSQYFSPYIFEIECLTQPGTHQCGYFGWPVRFRDLLLLPALILQKGPSTGANSNVSRTLIRDQVKIYP